MDCWWEGKLVQPLWKIVWSFLKKLKIGEFSRGPVVSIPCCHCQGSIPGHRIKILQVTRCSQKIFFENRTTIQSSNFTYGYLPEKNKNTIQKDTCTPMFKEALFTIVKIWKQPKCPSIDECVNKWIYVCRNSIQPLKKFCHWQQHG